MSAGATLLKPSDERVGHATHGGRVPYMSFADFQPIELTCEDEGTVQVVAELLWPTAIAPVVGGDFDVARVARWYMHQANGIVVRRADELFGLPAERIPLNVDRYGNTSAASALILLDEDRRADRVQPGDLVVFLWIGARDGARNGYAAMIL